VYSTPGKDGAPGRKKGKEPPEKDYVPLEKVLNLLKRLSYPKVKSSEPRD
jgi:hypothetical protein